MKEAHYPTRAHNTLVLAIILSFGQACVYVASGMYGTPSDLGAGICVLLVVQLVVAGVGMCRKDIYVHLRIHKIH